MKVRLNVDLEIDLGEGGKRIQVAKLWEAAQGVAGNAAKSGVYEEEPTYRGASCEPGAAGTENDSTHPADLHSCANANTQSDRPESVAVSEVLNPLGTFFCDLLDHLGEASQGKTVDDLKRSGPE